MEREAHTRRIANPPLDMVRRLQRELNRAGLANTVGGSGLLASLGLVEEVRDWDVAIDCSPLAVQSVLDDLALPYRRLETSGRFRTEAGFVLDAGDHRIDVLVRFALDSLAGVVSIPARTGHQWNGLTMARAED